MSFTYRQDTTNTNTASNIEYLPKAVLCSRMVCVILDSKALHISTACIVP